MRRITTLLLALVSATAGCEKYELDRQMEELCKKDGGVTVFETVKLPPSDFSKDGMPLGKYWFDPTLIGTTARLGPDYKYTNTKTVLKAGDPLKGEGQLTRYVEEVHRAKDDRLLGTSVWYGRAGGDLIVIDHFSTNGCPQSAPPLLTSVFQKEQ